MLPRPSSLSRLIISSAVVAAALLPWSTARAQEATATDTPVAASSAALDKKLVGLADDFLHYSIVGNVQLAHDNGQALLNENLAPKDLLAVFEAAANERDIPAILTRDQRQADLKDVAKQIQDQLEAGHRAVSRDPARIKVEIERLDDSPRAYDNAKGRLEAAGPFAVPYYIQYLQNDAHKSLQPYILKIISEIGRPLLPPLLEQLKTPNVEQKIVLVKLIGQIGYAQAVPYLKDLVRGDAVSSQLKAAVEAAIAQCDGRGDYAGSAADGFMSLSIQYYRRDPRVAIAYPAEVTNPVWFYDKGLDNVLGTAVPTSIWTSVEAMRTSERALEAESNKSSAISLWIAANLRREILLPAGAKDPTLVPGTPDASFFAVAAGPVYLNPVLELAIHQKESALILKTISALKATGGTQGLVSTKADATPLVKALSYPDRAVRFTSAFALARANPAKDYAGSYRVIPVLAEAVSQTGMPSILLVEPNQENRNRLKSLLTGFNVYDGADLASALESARRAAAFDVVIVPAATNPQLQNFERTDYRLAAAPALLLTEKPSAVANASTLEIKSDIDAKGLTDAVASVKAQIGQTPIDADAATAYAQTAIQLLGFLAADHASIYNVNDAVPVLVAALKDKRPEVITASAGVLSQLNNTDAQKALAQVALAEATPANLRGTLLLSLAESAKRTGNALDNDSIDTLIKLVANKTLDAETRSAAATALGALNVPSNQASTLILQQAK